MAAMSRHLLVAGFALVAVACATVAVTPDPDPPGPPPSFAEARSKLREMLGKVARGPWEGTDSDYTWVSQEPLEKIEITTENFTFTDRGVSSRSQSRSA